MILNKEGWSRLLLSAAALLNERSIYLSEIDSRFGDGDHGVTIGKIAAQIRAGVEGWDEENLKGFFENLGASVMGVNGGSAGPLYGTLLGGLGEALGEERETDGPLLKQMLQGSLEAMCDITKARVGDKTMMDALIPAVQAACEAPDEVEAILEAAAEAAEAGAKASEGFVSKFGRARSYKEQTIGTPDAGAVSTSLLFRGLAQGLTDCTTR